MKYLRLPFIVINVLTVLLMWVAALCGTMSPHVVGWLSLGGYVFPLLFMVCVAFMLFWVFVKKRFLLISFIGLVAVYKPALTYCPLNTASSEHSPIGGDGGGPLTILTFNACDWGNDKSMPDSTLTKADKKQKMISQLIEMDADILFMQEATLRGNEEALSRHYQYCDTLKGIRENSVCLTLYSKYPIKRKEKIPLQSTAAAGAFWLDIDGREVIALDMHLESMHLSMNDRKRFSTMVHGEDKNRDSIRSTSQTIVGKIYQATRKRADQAEQVADFITRHSDMPLLLCGDFNDLPISYTHDTILKALNTGKSSLGGNEGDAEGHDCYTATAMGPGYTFKRFGMRVRIDNIMCSRHFTPINCHIVKNITLSDHLPLICQLAFSR
ncbi:MAG: endonuclease/exonuclease/phosphatase family protein [Oscillospiraceae bacterium]|nr:endonuclease/exonuclease/phosphatase family protein [Oscillospiraceae bacterium]